MLWYSGTVKIHIFIIPLGSQCLLHPRVRFKDAKAQGARGENGQSFESVSDRLHQLSVYINKLEF